MNPAPPTAPPTGKAGGEPPLLAAWPRSAQLAMAFLLGLATGLLVLCWVSLTRWGSRPSELYPADGRVLQTDLNRAPRAELAHMPNVGDRLAERIEARRTLRGGFRSVEELDEVPGIGPRTVERLRPAVRVDADAERPRSGKEAALTGRIDVNRASVEELQRLPGIGPKLSQRIADERTLRGPFRSPDDLRRVSGIGPKTLEKLRPFIYAGSEPGPLARDEAGTR